MRAKQYVCTVVALLLAFLPVSGLLSFRAEAVAVLSDLRFDEVILQVDTSSCLIFRVDASVLDGVSAPKAVFTLQGEEHVVSSFTTSSHYCDFALPLTPLQLSKPVTAYLTAQISGTPYRGNEVQKAAIEFGKDAFDVDEDHDISITDLIRLKKYFLQTGSVYVSSAADPKRDDVLDSQDMTALQKYLLIAPPFSEIHRVPAYPGSATVEISRTGKQNSLGTYTDTVNRVCGPAVGGSVDLSGADQIEFDIFIEDQAAFADAVAGKELCFLLLSGSNGTDNRAEYDLTGKIQNNGWNHLVLTKSSPTRNSGVDFADITRFGLLFREESGNNPLSATEVRLINLYATKKTGGSWTEEDDDL